MKLVGAEEALSHLKSGQRVFLHGGAATPFRLLQAFVAQAPRLKQVEVLHLHTMGEALEADPRFASSFRVANLFVGPNIRPYFDYDRVDYLPCFLSEIPQLFRKGRRAPDVALIHVSPPDRHGFCSLGTSVDVAKAAVESATLVIAQVNPRMPRTFGDGAIHESQIHFGVEVTDELPESPAKPLTEVETSIGRHVASLVEDGATLQMGIGSIPDAVWAQLGGHRQLGLHSEMWSDGALPLLEKGVIDNSRKTVEPGKTVGSFVTGTRKLFDFIDDNPSVFLLDAAIVNNPRVIAKNKKATSINSAVEVDLTGQVCADSIGGRVISGVGGQVDFLRGASLSEGGKAIIALPSRTKHKQSRLVPVLKTGAGVVTTRAHVHFVVTEYGVVDLFGLTLGERAKALISIAHPEDRESLEKAWFESHKLPH